MKQLYKNIKLQINGENVVKSNCEKHFLQTKKEINEHFESLISKNNLYKEKIQNIEKYYEKAKEFEAEIMHKNSLESSQQQFFKKENIEKRKNKFVKIQSSTSIFFLSYFKLDQFESKLNDFKTLFDHYSLKEFFDNLQLNIELDK